MTGAGTLLLHLDPHRVLVAVDAHLHDALAVTRGFTFAPEALARAAEVAGFAARDGLLQRLRVHMGDHQHVAGLRIGHHAGDESLGVEFGREGKTFLDLFGRDALGERGNLVGQDDPQMFARRARGQSADRLKDVFSCRSRARGNQITHRRGRGWLDPKDHSTIGAAHHGDKAELIVGVVAKTTDEVGRNCG